MEAALDMNSNKILNVGQPTADTDAVRLVDLEDAIDAARSTLSQQDQDVIDAFVTAAVDAAEAELAILAIPLSQKGAVNGVASLGSDGLVPTAQLPPAGWGVDIKWYGCRGDGLRFTNGAVTASSTTLTCASATFTTSDVGKLLVVQGAGTNGIPLVTTITARLSATSVTMGTAALTTAASTAFVYGTDDTAAFNVALATGRSLVVPNGRFCIKPTLSNQVSGQLIVGESNVNSIITLMSPLAGNGLFNGNTVTGCGVHNLKVDGLNLIGTYSGLINYYNCTQARTTQNSFVNVHRFCIMWNSMNYGVLEDNYIQHNQRVGVWLSAFVPGAGGPLNATGLVATVSGGTQLEAPVVTYNTDGAGSVSSVSFSNHGEYSFASAVPTISFPAVPGSSGTLVIGGTQVTAITIASTTFIPTRLSIQRNLCINANINLSCTFSTIKNNYVRTNLYGGGIVADTNLGATSNIYTDNIIYLTGYNNTTALYQGPDTDNALGVGLEIYSSRSIIANNVSAGCAGNGIDSGGQHCQVNNNNCWDNGGYYKQIGGPYIASGITLRYVTSGVDSSGTIVSNNNLYDNQGASGAQCYGIRFESSSVAGVSLYDNNCQGNRVGRYVLNGATIASFRGESICKTTTVDVPSLAAGAIGSEIAISVSGVTAAGTWDVSCTQKVSAELGVTLNGYIKGDNQVGIIPVNCTSAVRDPASATLIIRAEEVIS